MEDFNGLESDKDKRSRRKANSCKDLVGQLVYMIMGDDSYLTTRTWDGRMELLKKAMDQLKDPQFILQQLKLLMQPIIMENTSSTVDVVKALQELELFLKQSKNTVLSQDFANEIYESFLGSIPLEVQPLQDAKEESQSFGKELKQMKTTLDQEHQSMREAKGYLEVASTNKGLYVDSFLPTQLNLEMSKYGGSLWDLDTLTELFTKDVPGTSNDRPNEANMDLSPDKTSMVQSYIVYKRNANVLTEILQKHPNIAKKFLVKHSDFQSFFMNSLAEVYQKIESKSVMLEVNDIINMEVMVEDMEFAGLQLSWLKEMLEKVVREKLNYKAEMKRLIEEIDSCEAKAKEAKHKLAKLEKKPWFG